MAIDILILVLLLISFTINFLALGAFCMTPGLRTKANRFVINLLIINLAGCLILASTLFLTKNILATIQTHSNNYTSSSDIITKDTTSDQLRLPLHGKQIIRKNKVLNKLKKSESILKHNSNYVEKVTIKERGRQIVVIQDGEKINTNLVVNGTIENNVETRKIEYTQFMGLWSIDLAAALGALSVLLVVGDTWMAVRDPLRYHSRISELKLWILITSNWTFGIFFGLISAYRQLNFECTKVFGNKRNGLPVPFEMLTNSTNTTTSIIFEYIYFIVIVLLPFGFVCGMYWRIFSETKENGMRIRKNILSPLLQITNNSSRKQQHKKTYCLEEKNISNKSLHNNRNSLEKEVNIHDKHPMLLPFSKLDETAVGEISSNKISINYNCASGQINKKFTSSKDFSGSDGLQAIQRNMYSMPNLQIYNHDIFMTGFETTSSLRYMTYQTIQIRTTQTSPKTINNMTLLPKRLSNTSSFFKHRDESRAARISILVIIMFLMSYLPYGFLVLLQRSQMIKNVPYSTQLEVIMILLGNLSSALIFAYRNKRVRHGVTRLFGFNPRSHHNRLQHECIFLRLVSKVSTNVKRNRKKLSTYSIDSWKYITAVPKHSRKSLQNTKYNMHTVGIYLNNSASIQSSTVFGNIAVFNAVVDDQLEYAQENVSILKTVSDREYLAVPNHPDHHNQFWISKKQMKQDLLMHIR